LDGWIILTPFWTEESNPTILGNTKTNAIHYELSKVVHDPGVYRYPDGSGQPPSDDVEPLEVFSNINKAVKEAACLWMKNHINNILESIDEEEFEKETEEIEKIEDEMLAEKERRN